VSNVFNKNKGLIVPTEQDKEESPDKPKPDHLTDRVFRELKQRLKKRKGRNTKEGIYLC